MLTNSKVFGGLIFLVLVLTYLQAFGIGERQKKTRQQEPKVSYSISVTPVNFFSGPIKRLKAHLEFQSAVCFKIKTDGPVSCIPDIELLRNGERVDANKYISEIDESSDEVSLTLRNDYTRNDDKIIYRVAVGGMYTFARYIEKPNLSNPPRVEFGPVSLKDRVDLKPDFQSLVVWAIGGGEGVDLTKPKEVEKTLKHLPWAMILRLRVEKKT
jgi:hypothetical protein